MANLVGITFVLDDDFLLLKMARTTTFPELRRTWEIEMKMSEPVHLFRAHTHDGQILPDKGCVSQLFNSPRNIAVIIYVEKRCITLDEKERILEEQPPFLQTVVDKNIQTMPVDCYPSIFYCKPRWMSEMADSVCNSVTPVFRTTNYDDALLMACFLGSSVSIVRWLVEDHHANPNVFGMTGASPLHYAARNGHEKIARYLIWHGAVIDARDKQHNTPLLLAAKEGQFKLVRLLIDADADIEVRDKDGLTPLMFATWRGHTQIVKWLLQYTTDVNTMSSNLWTPVMRACIKGHHKCLQMFLDRQCDILWCNNHGRTAMVLAARRGHLKCVQILLETKVDMVDQQLKDAYQIARDRAEAGVSRYLKLIIDAMTPEQVLAAVGKFRRPGVRVFSKKKVEEMWARREHVASLKVALTHGLITEEEAEKLDTPKAIVPAQIAIYLSQTRAIPPRPKTPEQQDSQS